MLLRPARLRCGKGSRLRNIAAVRATCLCRAAIASGCNRLRKAVAADASVNARGVTVKSSMVGLGGCTCGSGHATFTVGGGQRRRALTGKARLLGRGGRISAARRQEAAAVSASMLGRSSLACGRASGAWAGARGGGAPGRELAVQARLEQPTLGFESAKVQVQQSCVVLLPTPEQLLSQPSAFIPF